MDPFFALFEHMLKDKPSEGFVRRGLMDEIGDPEGLVCIRGERGVGKTRFLLDYAEEKCRGKVCLYASLNYFYFSVHTLYSFAAAFVRRHGGEVLLLDQVYKYPGWAEELQRIHKDFGELCILFTTSSVMNDAEDFRRLGGEVRVYELPGFSFREYLSVRHRIDLPRLSPKEILTDPERCMGAIPEGLTAREQIDAYVHGGGYYPPAGSYFSPRGVSLSDEELVKHLNMLLEVDVVYIRQIDPGYLPKLRQLLYTIANSEETPKQNVSRLSEQLGISRATVMNYIRHLSDAGLIRLLYKSGESEGTKKPISIYVGNPCILSSLTLETPDPRMVSASFLLSHLSGLRCPVTVPYPAKDLWVFRLGDEGMIRLDEAGSVWVHEGGDERGTDEKEVPLQLFGFIY